jgi:RsiW-degrading membrane proteinase PrsW (M82 family)
MTILILVIIAIIPPIALMAYVLYMDREEPEPLSYVILVMFLGAVAVLPAALIEIGLQLLPIFQMGGWAGAAINSFLVIAPTEELLKLLVVILFVWKNKNFNEENDGIVYVGTAAIGFALFENLLYVLDEGIAVGIMRAVTSIPLHTFTGILMGYYVGIAKFAADPKTRRGKILKGLFIAYLFHAVYDTLVLSETGAALLIVPLVTATIILGVLYLRRGRRLSLARWQRSGAVPESVPEPEKAPMEVAKSPGKARVIKVIISRILFVACAGFWALLFIGMSASTEDFTWGEFFGAGTMFTFIPIIIGIILEISYYRDKRKSRRSDV